MAHDEDTPAGFLSRWSRRKAEVREGRPLAEPKPPLQEARPLAPPPVVPAHVSHEADASPAAQQAPTLADAQQLTPESDFTGFMARGVAPDVKNAAMKQLFTDPHFNVMDRMDIYIDDYSQPDPLPLAMLRQMASAKTLNLFDDEPASKVVAQSAPAKNNPNPEPSTHDHADLRLQPDPTARPEGPEPEPV
jgi:hypothetical protein